MRRPKTRVVALALLCTCVACTSSPPPPEPAVSREGDEPKQRRSLDVRAALELRPTADHGAFAKALAAAPSPVGIEVRLQPLSGRDGEQEAVFEADDLTVLTQWSAEQAPSLPPGLRMVYQEAANHSPTLTQPLGKGWTLHLIRTDDGFELQQAKVRLVTSKFDARPELEIELSKDDGERFAELSARMVDRKLAIVLGDQLLSAPMIRERIDGGRLIITLGASDDPDRAAQTLVGKLAGVPASEAGPPVPRD